jgi:hypothetical protein
MACHGGGGSGNHESAVVGALQQYGGMRLVRRTSGWEIATHTGKERTILRTPMLSTDYTVGMPGSKDEGVGFGDVRALVHEGSPYAAQGVAGRVAVFLSLYIPLEIVPAHVKERCLPRSSLIRLIDAPLLLRQAATCHECEWPPHHCQLRRRAPDSSRVCPLAWQGIASGPARWRTTILSPPAS